MLLILNVKFAGLSLFLFVSFNCLTQEVLTAQDFIGKWAWCIPTIDSQNINCDNPIDTVEFKEKGIFLGGLYYRVPSWSRQSGKWDLDNSNRKIAVIYDETTFSNRPTRLFLDIHFINKNLFFTRAISTTDGEIGKLHYTYYKRLNSD